MDVPLDRLASSVRSFETVRTIAERSSMRNSVVIGWGTRSRDTYRDTAVCRRDRQRSHILVRAKAPSGVVGLYVT